MEWENGSIYSGLRNAIIDAKDPARDFLRDPAIIAPIARLADLSMHGYFAREGAGDIPEVHGWKRIKSEDVHRKAGFMTNLDMEVWQRGDATVVSVMSVWGPQERNGDDIDFAANKIAELSKKYPNLVLVGHGDKGSTAVLEAAKRAQAQGLPVPPTLALEPYPPEGMAFKKDAPVVGINLTANTFLNKLLSPSRPQETATRNETGFRIRKLDGSNVVGTGLQVASNWMNSIDVRGYYGALSIASVQATHEKDIGAVVPPTVQPWVVRAFNPDSGADDFRMRMIEGVKSEIRSEGLKSYKTMASADVPAQPGHAPSNENTQSAAPKAGGQGTGTKPSIFPPHA